MFGLRGERCRSRYCHSSLEIEEEEEEALMFLGSAAAGLQPLLNPVGAGGLFATLQSAGAGGYGVAAVNAVVRGTVVVAQGAKHLVTSFWR